MKGYVYILTNKNNNVFYVGVTSNLIQRIWQHKRKIVKGFTNKYNLQKLVHYEVLESIQEAIKREKFIKGKKRKFKTDLITKTNPEYKDLYEDIVK